MKEYLCACNGKPCEGTCRKEHLFNKSRLFDGICSAAYTEEEMRRSSYGRDIEDIPENRSKVQKMKKTKFRNRDAKNDR